MHIKIPARILRMSRRRQKIALKSLLQNRLAHLAGQPNSPFLRAEVKRIVFGAFGLDIEADVTVQPHVPVDYITLDFVVTTPA